MMEREHWETTFSFVSPAYNEQEGLETFYNRLTAVAQSLGEPYEIIFINDGSTDDTAGVIRRLSAADSHIKWVEFSRNFGHQVAVTAGYDYAKGKAVISMDADCQHPPEVIPQLVARWREGFEIVYTVRSDTDGISPLRRGIGRLMYKAIRMVSGIDLTDQADFRLMDYKAVRVLRRMKEQARFVRGLVNWIGFKQIGIPYKAERRSAGKSNYTLKQLVKMSTAGLCNFSNKPLRLAPFVGAAMLAVALCYAVISVLLWPFGAAPSAIAHLFMAVVGLFGIQFLMLGIIGEYIGRIFDEAKDRPLYIVREEKGFDLPVNPPVPYKSDKADKRYVLYT